VLSLGARLLMARGLGRGRLLAPLALGWLALFPNAPYLLTDFIHLHQRPVVPLWFDAALLALFAATGGGPGPGPASEPAWEVPAAPISSAPQWGPSPTPAPFAGLHTADRRTRPA